MLNKLKILAAAIILLVLMTQPSWAESVTYEWTEPTDGTAVVYYLVGLSANGGGFVTMAIRPDVPEITLSFEPNVSYVVRVAGVDADGHVGCWSAASEAYLYGAPGCCGVPSVRGE